MKKMEAASLADLVRMAGRLEIPLCRANQIGSHGAPIRSSDSLRPGRGQVGAPQSIADGREKFLPVERLLEHTIVTWPVERRPDSTDRGDR